MASKITVDGVEWVQVPDPSCQYKGSHQLLLIGSQTFIHPDDLPKVKTRGEEVAEGFARSHARWNDHIVFFDGICALKCDPDVLDHRIGQLRERFALTIDAERADATKAERERCVGIAKGFVGISSYVRLIVGRIETP